MTAHPFVILLLLSPIILLLIVAIVDLYLHSRHDFYIFVGILAVALLWGLAVMWAVGPKH